MRKARFSFTLSLFLRYFLSSTQSSIGESALEQFASGREDSTNVSDHKSVDEAAFSFTPQQLPVTPVSVMPEDSELRDTLSGLLHALPACLASLLFCAFRVGANCMQ